MRRWKSLFILPLVLELSACGQFSSNEIERNFTVFIEMTGGEHTSLDADTTGETLRAHHLPMVSIVLQPVVLQE